MYDQNLWESILVSIIKSVDANLVDTWLKPCKISANRADAVTVIAPSKFHKNWVEKHYLNLVQNILKDEFSIDASVRIRVDESSVTKVKSRAKEETPPAKDNFSPFDARFTFENFVVGDSNSFAHTAALAIADGNFSVYNPLYIYGGTGLGKTHLIHAVANRVWKKFPKMTILYMDSETFAREAANAFNQWRKDPAQNHVERLKERFRSVDLFILDDIQFLKTKGKTLEIFFNTFNDLYTRQKQVIITSDESPQEIDIDDRVRSRFASGLPVEIHPPAPEELAAILIQKAVELGLALDDHLAFFLAENAATKNVRELIGVLHRIKAYVEFYNVPMTEDLAKRALEESGQLRKPNKLVSPQQLISVVSDIYNVKLSDLVSKKRTHSIVYPRQVAMYLMKDRLELSLKEIGGYFGGRDHTTVKYAVDNIKEKIKSDEYLADTIGKIAVKVFG